jgi:hypothetical protein
LITEKALKEFKLIYKKEFSVDLSDQDALEKATQLLNLTKTIYNPIIKNNYEKRRKN